MVTEGRIFEGELPLARMPRLREALLDADGAADCRLQFGRNPMGGPELHVRVRASLPLECQRTLQRFHFPVEVDTRLGLIDNMQQEAGLPEGVEPLLLDDGMLEPAAVVEDELLLTLPLVPVKPGSELPPAAFDDVADEPDEPAPNPFAVLDQLKHKN